MVQFWLLNLECCKTLGPVTVHYMLCTHSPAVLLKNIDMCASDGEYAHVTKGFVKRNKGISLIAKDPVL